MVVEDGEYRESSQGVKQREARVAGRWRHRRRRRARTTAQAGHRRGHSGSTSKARSRVADGLGVRAARIHSPAMQREQAAHRPLRARSRSLGALAPSPRGASCCRASTRQARGRSSRSARTRAISPACWSTGRRARGRARDRGRPVAAPEPRPPGRRQRRARAGARHEPRRAARLGPADAVIIDGDHNYYTVSRGAAADRRGVRRRAAPAASSTTSAGRTPAATTTTRPT